MRTMAKNRTKVAWSIGLFLSFSALIVLALVGFLPYNEIKEMFDLLTPDRELESFTKEVHDVLRFACLAGFVLAAGALTYLLAFRQKAQKQISALIEGVPGEIKGLKKKTLSLYQAAIRIETDRRVFILLILLTLIAALNRVPYLWRPMGHDEAYTYIAFASRGLRIAITDYHLPNNHVFHTILVSLATWLFGDSPAVVRLPVFLAGVSLIPAMYILARPFYGKEAGLVCAAFLASAPVLIDYSTNARGYMLISLFTVLLLALGAYVVRNRNEIGWVLMVLIASLGIYTNPTMIFPIAALYTWLLLEALFDDTNPSYGRKIYIYMMFSIAGIMLATAVLYAPVALYSGLDSLMGNNFIAPLGWSEFVQSVPVRMRNTWAEWNRDLPGAFSWIGIAGLGSWIAFSFKRGGRMALLFVASIIGIGSVLLILKVAPWPRVWLFLFPLVVMWITAGLLRFFQSLTHKMSADGQILQLVSGLLIGFALLAGAVRSYTYFTTKSFSPGEVEKAAIYLSGTVVSGDVVVVTSPDAAILDYYLRRQGIDRSTLENNVSRHFRRALVLVNTGYGQDLEYVLKERSFSENVDQSAAELIFSANRIEIYAVPGIN